MTQNHTPSNAFDAWCWAHGYESDAVIGKAFKVTGETIRRWRLPLHAKDFLRPSQDKMAAIYQWTEGKVTPNHWFNLGAAVSAVAGSGRTDYPTARTPNSPGDKRGKSRMSSGASLVEGVRS